METFGALVVLLALGKLLAWRGLAGDRTADALNTAAIYVFFPAVILRQAPTLSLDARLVWLPLVAWAVIALGIVVGVVAHRLGVERGTATATALGIGFGNTAFIGYAVIPALLGTEALRYAVLSDQLGSFIGVSTVGLLAITLASGGKRPTVLAMLRRVVTFPPFIALVVGVTLMPVEPPAVVVVALESLGKPLLPGMAIAVGLRLRFSLPPATRGPLAVIVVGKLVVAPALALALCTAGGMDGVVRDVVVLQAAMPVMVTIGALLAFAGVATELSATMVALTTVLSMATLPLWAALLRHVG